VYWNVVRNPIHASFQINRHVTELKHPRACVQVEFEKKRFLVDVMHRPAALCPLHSLAYYAYTRMYESTFFLCDGELLVLTAAFRQHITQHSACGTPKRRARFGGAYA
jgi:hypothetical protein